MPSVASILGTFSEQCSTKDQLKTFQVKVKQYVLRKFDNPRGIIIAVRDLKDAYAHIDMDKPINISKEDKDDIILVTHLQEKAKDYVNRV